MAISRAHVLYHLLIVGITSPTLFSRTRMIYLRAMPKELFAHQARVEGNNAITGEDNPSLMLSGIIGSRCHLTGASEMEERGLDQLDVPCMTVQIQIKREEGTDLAGVVTAVSTSAFESPNLSRLEINLLYYFSSQNLFSFINNMTL